MRIYRLELCLKLKQMCWTETTMNVVVAQPALNRCSVWIPHRCVAWIVDLAELISSPDAPRRAVMSK